MNRKIFIANLPICYSEKQLIEKCRDFGTVLDFNFLHKDDSKCAWITYSEQKEARFAIAGLSDIRLEKGKLKVYWAKEKAQNQSVLAKSEPSHARSEQKIEDKIGKIEAELKRMEREGLDFECGTSRRPQPLLPDYKAGSKRKSQPSNPLEPFINVKKTK